MQTNKYESFPITPLYLKKNIVIEKGYLKIRVYGFRYLGSRYIISCNVTRNRLRSI